MLCGERFIRRDGIGDPTDDTTIHPIVAKARSALPMRLAVSAGSGVRNIVQESVVSAIQLPFEDS
jgi:hypothetical protein